MSKSTRTNKHKKIEKQRKLPSIALCVIAKNEEEFLAGCLESARAFVDEIVVLDTGSTDRTREIAREHGARVEEFEWCNDFGAARNAAIDQATADWILMLDADECLRPEAGPLLGYIAAGLPDNLCGYVVEIENQNRQLGRQGAITHQVARFFPRRPTLRFVGRIHEELTYIPEPSATAFGSVAELRVIHYGYDPEIYSARDKHERNIRLLEAELEHDPENARVLYYIAQQYHGSWRYAEAPEWCERALQYSHSLRMAYTVELYRMWLDALSHLGDREGMERVTALAEQAEALGADTRELLAVADWKAGRLDAARRHLEHALQPDAPRGLAWAPGSGSWRTRALLADVHQDMGDTSGALAIEETMFGELPADLRRNVAFQAAQLAIRAGNAESAYMWLPRASEEAADDIDAQLAVLQLRLVIPTSPAADYASPTEAVDAALAARDWQAAYDAVLALPLRGGDSFARVLFVAMRLREQGDPRAALDVLGGALDAYPTSAPLYWQLVDVLTELERFEDALAAVEVLRQLPGNEHVTLAA
jgi:glycosyltransferase involved in cell wall biosynthesis